jgi:hypothetical protein
MLRRVMKYFSRRMQERVRIKGLVSERGGKNNPPRRRFMANNPNDRQQQNPNQKPQPQDHQRQQGDQQKRQDQQKQDQSRDRKPQQN